MRPRHAVLVLASLAAVLCGCSGQATRKIEKLLADLESDSDRRRARAERNLAEHGRAAIKPLSAIVTGTDVEKLELDADWNTLRVPAAKALGLMAARASLARSEAELAAEPLLEALKKTDLPELRLEAAKALGHFTQLSTPVNDLILLLREDDAELVKAASGSLVHNALHAIYRLKLVDEPGSATVAKDWDRLVERLASTDDDIRLDTVNEIAASGDPKAPEVLLKRLADDKSGEVRYAALRACQAAAQDKPDSDFAKSFHKQLPTSFEKDDDSRVVLVAAGLLRKDKADLVGAFIERLERTTTLCVTALMASAESREYDAAARSDAVNALGRAPGDERDALLAKLATNTREPARIRRAAANVLAGSGSDKAGEALRTAMTDEDSIVQLVAAQALGRGGDTDAVQYLVDLLSHGEAKIRTPAADALGTLGTKAIGVLVKSLTGALDGAATLKQWEAPLAELKRKAEPTAADAAKIRELEAAAEKHRAKTPGRDDKLIAWGIATGLGSIAAQVGQEAAPAFDAVVKATACHYVDVRRAAVNALGHFEGDGAIGALVAALKDEDASVRWYTASALERHGAAAAPALATALGDPATAAIAAKSLGRMGGPDALKPLLDRLPEAGAARPDVVWAIGELLTRHPDAPQAAAARQALEAAAKLTDDPEAARLAGYALTKVAPQR